MMARLSYAVAAVTLLAAACSERPLPERAASGGTGNFGLGGAGGGTFTPTRMVDMLFVVDDSPETTLLQQNLLRNFPTILNTLSNSPAGLPDLRIAVVSTDMGAGDGSIAQCDATGGKNGIFQYTARGACTSTGLAPGATFIANNGVVQNYTGNLADVFTCIARLGEQGCGFEHQLAAAARALGADGQAPPEENQGFLRPEAYLFIIVVTNEDDCSAPPGSSLFELPDALNGPFGFAGNYRCNEFGHLCNGVKPPRIPPSGDASEVVTLHECHSAEEAGMLIPVARLVAQIRSLKRFPDQQIVVTAIAGPAEPYEVHWTIRGNETSPRAHIGHSCTASDGSIADPAVRIADWVSAFGANALFLPACATDFAPAAQRLGDILNQ
jgi:hypothetical protein